MPIDCVAIGDTIALNLSSALHCIETRAAANLTTSRVIDIANGNDVYHDYCIVSVGTYDTSKDSTINIRQVRDKSVCKYYVWVLPQRIDKSQQVLSVARHNRDYTVTYNAMNDGVTPNSYTDLANTIINKTNN